ncbi:MAG: hypothetical protein ACJ8J0_24035 [Longimicrobiaceae bacterium]
MQALNGQVHRVRATRGRPATLGLVAVWSCALSWACPAPAGPAAGPTGSRDAAPIRTDRHTYVLRRAEAPYQNEQSITIVATYRNPTSRTIHLAECQKSPPLYRLEKKEGGVWVRAYDPLCWAIAPERLQTLAPGQERTDTLRIRHYAGGEPSFRGSGIAGTYRLVYEVYASYDPNRSPSAEPLPGDVAVSNEFTIEVPR